MKTGFTLFACELVLFPLLPLPLLPCFCLLRVANALLQDRMTGGSRGSGERAGGPLGFDRADRWVSP